MKNEIQSVQVTLDDQHADYHKLHVLLDYYKINTEVIAFEVDSNMVEMIIYNNYHNQLIHIITFIHNHFK
jgi:hypothetical protein